MKTYNWATLTDQEQVNVLARPAVNNVDDICVTTSNILQKIRLGGDQALLELTAKYDQVLLDELRVSKDEFQKAAKYISKEAKEALEFAKEQLEINHLSQVPQTQTVSTSEGVTCERQYRPVERVGLYIPGGTAALVSTVLMTGIPAKIANCPVRILCTPANKLGKIDPHLLYAAELSGIQKVYKVGGAQAIAAMAYGTETIPKVDKIFGPGNSWVTQAKLMVSQDPFGASIDMPAGPSEIMIIADNNSNPHFVAADLLSQAEHGIDSQVMLITLSDTFAVQVRMAISAQLKDLPRFHIAKQALKNSRILIVEHIHQAIDISNTYAPEHLILAVENSDQYTSLIKNAGAVFLGAFTPETVGDYVTGSNHVLPTFGYARCFSGLSILDFMKFISFQKVTQAALKKIGRYATTMADIEGLHAHKQAVVLRLAQGDE